MIRPYDKTSGFTLIELLVVIAIIGILAVFVLAGVRSARDKSEDVRVKSGIRQFRAIAENFYDGNVYSYDGFGTCITTPNATNCLDQETADQVTTLKTDIEDANSLIGSLDASSSETDFCLAAPLKSSATTYVCVDFTGRQYEDESTDPPCSSTTSCTYN